MKEKAKPSNKKKLIAAVAVSVAVIIAAAVTAVFILKDRGGSDDASAAISTPIGNFTLPAEVMQNMEIEKTSEGDVYRAGFYGSVGDSRILLFELVVGGDEGRYLLGSAPDKHRKMCKVWLNIGEIKADPSWSDEDVKRLNLMQSCVNEIISQLNNMKKFERAQ